MRFCRAAVNIGARIIVTDNDGYPFWTSDGKPVDTMRQVTRDDADFMISLHFETPRLLDIPSYYAIWQPVSFYSDFGYARSTEKLLTHSGMLSCSADLADAHIRNLLISLGQDADVVFPYLFHSPPEPYYPPSITRDSRLFYIGINWERLGQSGKGRHQELLRLLDEADLIDIYGPRMFLGVQPWEGYTTYRGELPFDGASVVRSLARSGICLAMSSTPHQKSGVMSNRLFEGLAAGCAIIANPHPIIEKYFSDVVWQINDTVSDEEIFHQIRAIVEEIRNDPEMAGRRALIGQERLREFFSLERCLSAVITRHVRREPLPLIEPKEGAGVTVILPYPDMSDAPLAELLHGLGAQTGVGIHLVLSCSQAFADGSGKAWIEAARKSLVKVTVTCDTFTEAHLPLETRGAAVFAALKHVDTPAFAVVRPGEDFFHDHFALLSEQLRDNPGSMAAGSGLLDESSESVRRRQLVRRTLSSISVPADARHLLSQPADPEPGCFLFRASLLRNTGLEALRLLDGCETSYLLVLAQGRTPVARTGVASCIRIVAEADLQRPDAASVERQQQFIVDRLRFDPAFRDLLSFAPPVSQRIAPTQSTDGFYCPILLLDRVVQVKAGEKGTDFLVAGFSTPEARAVWIDGETGLLRFRLGDLQPEDRDLDLVIQMGGRPSQITGRDQHATVAVNGAILGYMPIEADLTDFVLRLPRGIRPLDILSVRVTADHAEPVLDSEGRVVDTRHLGIFIGGIGVRRGPRNQSLPLVDTGMSMETSRRGSGLVLLQENCFPSDEAVWVSNAPARLAFRVAAISAESRTVTLQMKAAPGLADPERLEVRVMANGMQIGIAHLGQEPEHHRFVVPPGLFGEGSALSIELVPHLDERKANKAAVRLFALLSLRLDDRPILRLGERYATSAQGSGKSFLAEGFSTPEADFTWVDGDRGALFAVVESQPESDKRHLILDFEAAGRQLSSRKPQMLHVDINRTRVGSVELVPEMRVFSLPFPAANLPAAARDVTIILTLQDPAEQVVEAGTGKVLDHRKLGVSLRSISIRPAP